MTSKEALEQVKWNVLTSTLLHKEQHLDLCELIEKDLEILEILKGKILLISDLESTNDFEKVKGWLYEK